MTIILQYFFNFFYKICKFLQINPTYNLLSIHSCISESDAPELNLCPSFQFPELASSCSNFPLWPKLDEAEVQNGITVLPVKSLSLTKVSTGQTAIPHYTYIYVQ